MCWLTVDVRYLFSTKALNPKDSEMADTLSREILSLFLRFTNLEFSWINGVLRIRRGHMGVTRPEGLRPERLNAREKNTFPERVVSSRTPAQPSCKSASGWIWGEVSQKR